jgi:hypothetical protein
MQLSIPQPCREDWSAMTPTEKGKFCAACQKQVVDFSQMPLPAIKRLLETPSGPSCGRFRSTQLEAFNSRYQPIPTPSLMRKWAAAAILTAAVAWPSFGQQDSTTPTGTDIPMALFEAGRQPAVSIADPVRISGKIVAANPSSKVHAGASITVSGTAFSTTSDSEGAFEFALLRSETPVWLDVWYFTGNPDEIMRNIGYQIMLLPDKDISNFIIKIEERPTPEEDAREPVDMEFEGIGLMGIMHFPFPEEHPERQTNEPDAALEPEDRKKKNKRKKQKPE